MSGRASLQRTALSVLLIAAWTGLINDLHGVEGSMNAAEVEQHLNRGKQYLAAGQLADALSQFHSAIEGDSKNYLAYYRRATVYLAMGKSKSALPDLDTVLTLKPDFNAARLQRANVKVRQGRLYDARADYEEILHRDPSNTEARTLHDSLAPLEAQIAEARAHMQSGDYQGAAHLLTKPIETCPWDPELHELRAECYIKLNDYQRAIADIRPVTKLRNDNTAAYLQLSTLLYEHGNAEDSLIEIRECLKLDADHKACHQHYKKVKKLFGMEQSIQSLKGESKWDECIEKSGSMLKFEGQVQAYVFRSWGYLCHCHTQAHHIQDALMYCNRLLTQDPDNAEALCDRADNYLNDEQFEEAIDDFKKAEGIETGDDRLKKRASDGVQRAQKLLKQSQKRDYYKILGVKRTAGKAEILKAYRKLAAKWHPDQQPEGSDKLKAEKMFIDIAAAKEVLTDPEKRSKFDQGEDPLDPEQQAQHNQQFYQGFNPFGQGGFNFKFNFN